ncbi:MAG TPA: hypothetical protein VJB99_00540 [Patescibacteria group bacterium]|nr:hypothetical protein [Patescibacteria group bacterium]
MGSKVPEGAVNRDGQLAFLRNKLLGNEAFGRQRGQWGGSDYHRPLGVLGRMIATNPSPTAFCQDWDQFAADSRVMGNLLARFRRDGWKDAEDELMRALQDRAYLLPEETVPLHETAMFTVVVFDFVRTLEMIRWIRCAHWSSLNYYLDELDDTWESQKRKSWWMEDVVGRTLTHRLFEAYPNLLEHTRARRKNGNYEGWDLCQSYQEQVSNRFNLIGFNLLDIGHALRLAWRTYNDHLELGNQPFGYICRTDQAEVLSRFSREEQEQIATWSVRLPKVTDRRDLDGLFIGFHPENVHSVWQKDSPMTSIGCSNGYGVVLLSRRWEGEPLTHTERHHKSPSISRVDIKAPDEPLAFELETNK